MSAGKFASRSGFEVGLEGAGLLSASESDGITDSLRAMLGSVGHTTAIVPLEPLFQILGNADKVAAAFFRLENVNVVESLGWCG